MTAASGSTPVVWAPPQGVESDLGLHARVLGHGPPTFLLLHGLAGSNRYFGAHFDRLRSDGRVVAPDLLGFGKSPRPDDSGYAPDDQARAVADTLARLEVRGPVYTGAHSLGTLVALRLAVDRPDCVRGVVAFGSPIYRSPEEARKRLARIGLWVRLFAMDTPWAKRACAWVCRHRGAAARLAEWMRPELPRELARDGVQHSWPSYSGSFRHLVRGGHVTADLARIRVPVRLIAGEEDGVLDIEFLNELSRAHPHVHVEHWPGAHDLPLTLPDRCVEALRSAAGIC